MKKIIKQYRVVFPTPAALVTSISKNNKPNIATAGEVFMISLNPLIVAVGFRPATYTYKLIHEKKEFVVNLPKEDILDAVDYCGCVSGRNIDKFKETGLTPLKAKYVSPPIIKECPVNIECQVSDIINLPYMDRDVFAAYSLAIHTDEEILGKDGLPDLTKFCTIALASGKYYRVANYLKHMRFTQNKLEK